MGGSNNNKREGEVCGEAELKNTSNHHGSCIVLTWQCHNLAFFKKGSTHKKIQMNRKKVSRSFTLVYVQQIVERISQCQEEACAAEYSCGTKALNWQAAQKFNNQNQEKKRRRLSSYSWVNQCSMVGVAFWCTVVWQRCWFRNQYK